MTLPPWTIPDPRLRSDLHSWLFGIYLLVRACFNYNVETCLDAPTKGSSLMGGWGDAALALYFLHFTPVFSIARFCGKWNTQGKGICHSFPYHLCSRFQFVFWTFQHQFVMHL